MITHRLNISPSFKPIKQKRRSLALERQKAVNEEVNKLHQVKAIREVEYPDWLANVVLVKKANGKWRLYIDFTDVNRALHRLHRLLRQVLLQYRRNQYERKKKTKTLKASLRRPQSLITKTIKKKKWKNNKILSLSFFLFCPTTLSIIF